MKINVQVVDTKTGILQSGMIEESTKSGFEIQNALAHFGVLPSEIDWTFNKEYTNFFVRYGEVPNTTKVVNIVGLYNK